jgi:asparagine synthase (glutamine-hydrolysing)
MCGISGEVRFDGVPADTAAVGRMTAALRSRAPTARVAGTTDGWRSDTAD